MYMDLLHVMELGNYHMPEKDALKNHAQQRISENIVFLSLV